MTLVELYTVLMGWAAFLSPYEVPDELPPVAMAPITYLQDKVCPSTMSCPVLGIFYRGTVYLRQDLDGMHDPYARSIIVHEFVHFLQIENDSHSETPDSCQKAYQREIEAYGIQNAYLTYPEGSRQQMRVNRPSCMK